MAPRNKKIIFIFVTISIIGIGFIKFSSNEVGSKNERLPSSLSGGVVLTGVIGGSVSVSQWPEIPKAFEVAMRERTVGVTIDGSYCSGFLIAPDFVLTAAHCLGDATDRTTAMVDVYDPNSASLFRSVGPISRANIFDHPNYSLLDQHDVLLLHLPERIKYSNASITLAKESNIGAPIKILTFGFGNTQVDATGAQSVISDIAKNMEITSVCSNPEARDRFSLAFAKNEIGFIQSLGDPDYYSRLISKLEEVSKFSDIQKFMDFAKLSKFGGLSRDELLKDCGRGVPYVAEAVSKKDLMAHGDSGGPIVAFYSDHAEVLAINSAGAVSDKKQADNLGFSKQYFYMESVANNISFINEIMNKKFITEENR